MEQSAIERAKAWMEDTYFDEADRKHISTLVKENNTSEIDECFYKDLEFGTGGIRSILGIGTNRINKYNVRKATQAVASAILEANESKKVAISYDSRKFSFDFAAEAASVFAGNGIEVFIFDRLNPVALLSYSVRYHGCQAGIMVTASHNPPEYNGYKVFWKDGAQVTPPNDQKIINYYQDIKDFNEIKYKKFDDGIHDGTIKYVGKEVEDAYHTDIQSAFINKELCKSRGKELNIVYTPIHGTGYVPCTRVLTEMGLTNHSVVEEQKMPDSDFPTVSSPNPENPEALKMAVDQMLACNGDIAMGSDPDTDRLGVAVNCNGEVKYPNGNQIGVLMLHYILTNLKEQDRLPKNPYFVKTLVTTPLQEKIAASFGVECESTLTGFKWICGRMTQLETEDPSRNFVFATEESFGYLNHTFIRDKDGIAPLALMAEITLWYKTQGMNLYDGLDKIYEQYGFHDETLLNLNYYGKEGAEKIIRIMNAFRNNDYPEICGQKVSIKRDYNLDGTGYPKSNILLLEMENGDKFFMRPSGTEPKIKFYVMINVNEGSLEEKKSKASATTKNILEFIKSEAEKA